MTKFSTDGAGAHKASALGMSWGGHSTEVADVLGALRADVLSGLALETSYRSGCGRGRVWDIDGIGAGAGDSHNHLQSSG